MPNGKGCLDCSYCTHWRSKSGFEGYPDGFEEGCCDYWSRAIPASPVGWKHRICAEFCPNWVYERDMQYAGWQTVAESVELKMSWFERPLEPGQLYLFNCYCPSEIEELMMLKDGAGSKDL